MINSRIHNEVLVVLRTPVPLTYKCPSANRCGSSVKGYMWTTRIWQVALLVSVVRANTETLTFKVPNYYDVPAEVLPYQQNQLEQINASTWAMLDYPILNATNYNLSNTLIQLPYDYQEKPSSRLLVKLNNYANLTFAPNDLINVKLCWPAIYPFDFRLDYKFIRAKEFGELGNRANTLDIYIDTHFQADFYAVVTDLPTMVEMNLVVSKLPSVIPIPIELYGVITYLVDICILLVALLPYIQMGLATLIQPPELDSSRQHAKKAKS